MKSYDNNPPREEKEEMKNTNTNLIGITVKFPNSNKTYDYIIEEDCRNYLCAGDKIRIVNEHFYNYGTAEVEVVCFDKQPTDNARLRIIAFILEMLIEILIEKLILLKKNIFARLKIVVKLIKRG